VREHFIAGHGAIAFSTRKSESCGSGGERLEPEMFQIDRRSDIPWVW